MSAPNLLPKFPKVRDHMDTELATLTPETPILDAVSFLLDHHITGAPVVDENGGMVGIITEKDCLNILATGANAEPPVGTVADFMSTEIVSVPPDMDIYFAAGLFLNNHFRRLPVVQNGRLMGVITRFDILRVIRANF